MQLEPGDIYDKLEFDKIIDLSRRAFVVDVLHLHGSEFRSNVKIEMRI